MLVTIHALKTDAEIFATQCLLGLYSRPHESSYQDFIPTLYPIGVCVANVGEKLLIENKEACIFFALNCW